MRKLLWIVVAVTGLAASPLANAQGVQGALDTEYQEARHHAANLVLRPEAPLEGISEDEVKTVADGSGMTTEEAQFILFEGSAIIVDFISANRTNPEFGAVEVRQNGKLEIRLRVTSASSQLPEELEGKLARPVETLVGGHSAAELDVAYDAAENLMHDVKARTGEYPPFRIEKDFESGLVVLQLSSSAELDKLEATLIPPHVVISTDQPLQLRSATVYAGQTLYPDCTVGFVAKNSSSGARGLVTARTLPGHECESRS